MAVELGAEIGLEFFHEEGDAFFAAPAMANGVFDLDFFGGGAVFEEDLDGVGDGSFVWIEVIGAVLGIFGDFHFFAEGIDAGIGGGFIFVMVRGEVSVNEGDGDHVLEAVVAIGRVMKWTGFGDDADGGFLGFDGDAFDVVEAVGDVGVELDGAFDSGLGVELGGEGDFEEDVGHDVIGEVLFEGEGLAFEEDVLKTPCARGERAGVTHFSAHDHEGEADGAGGGVAGGP